MKFKSHLFTGGSFFMLKYFLGYLIVMHEADQVTLVLDNVPKSSAQLPALFPEIPCY